nr:methyl-CpG-binding domain protein 1b isoform X2 [Misgurnus anguillicaudatus]XP_055040315.1 methyl-CpG-binding domain protein 1b isoform X2 [Misgurnus anguillicaudatus]XP_055040317.1 methyl-CpG-binding domain protein 1b isoform X2 [Misgurnus anguillicaudatus]XP_055040318.1 methyl-CpG-binding domain protein 1b isoform X2 [Misgurnus anguillicaudatus]
METEEAAAVIPAEPPTEEKDSKEPASGTDIQVPAIEEKIQDPATDEKIQDPATDEKIQDTATDEKIQDPATDEKIQDPATDEKIQDTATDEKIQDPATDEKIQDPATDEKIQDPVADNSIQDPATDNKEEKVATDNKEEKTATDNNEEKTATEVEGETSKVTDNPVCDWLEPLDEDCEDVDNQSFDRDGTGDAELESLAGSEWSVTSSRRNLGERGGRGGGVKRRRRAEDDEDWEDCPLLGKGWKRKQVFRRSGTSEGRSDTYYRSPGGQKVRSKVELMKYLDESKDLSNFDFKTGQLLVGGARKRVKRLNPNSSQLDPNTKSGTPPKSIPHTNPVTDTTLPSPTTHKEPTAIPANPPAPPSRESLSGTSDGLVNGNGVTSQPLLGSCQRCNKTISVDEGQTICQNCRKELNASIDRRRKLNKKWLPCGRCRACQLTVDCGKCVNCKNGRLNARSRKVLKCRKRKCMWPIRNDRFAKGFPPTSHEHPSNSTAFDIKPSYSKPPISDIEESQTSFMQYSDSEDVSLFLGNDGDNGMDEFGSGKVRRRSCGRCRGCIRRTDCGTCDFCMDKPKFGGRNKKRQKCRLRQCQREAMKHLLPMDESQGQMLIPQDWFNRGRRRTRGRPRSRKLWDFEDNGAEQFGRPKASAYMANRNRLIPPNYRRKAFNYPGFPNSHILNNIPLYSSQNVEISTQLHIGSVEMMQGSGLQDSGISSRALLSVRPDFQHKVYPAPRSTSSSYIPSYVEESFRQEKQSFPNQEPYQEEHHGDSSPSITQIFSMADSTTKGIDPDHELMPLLKSLHSMVLPVLWFCIVAEGPQLQLVQCSKRSAMADTVVIIEPGFQYYISVQGQPLLPTHKLYDIHPTRLTTTTEIVALLEDLERHIVCQGFENKHSPPGPEPVLPERAATCDFLILPESERCPKCSAKIPPQT